MRTHTRFFRRGRTAVREPHADIVLSCLPELVAPTVRLHSAWLEPHDGWGPGRHEDGFGLGPSDEVGSRDGFAAWVTMPAGQSGPEAAAAGHDARGDRGELDARRPEFVGDLQAAAVTGGEDLGLSLVAAFPHGPPAWITCLTRGPRPKAGAAIASPGGQGPMAAPACASRGPAARWMAPSTPPPPVSDSLAAVTTASVSSAGDVTFTTSIKGMP